MSPACSLMAFYLALFFHIQTSATEPCHMRNDSAVLLSFASSITGSRNWPVSWNITIMNGSIVGLNLSGLNLTSPLSSAWSELPALEFLDLSSNNFSGLLSLSAASCHSLRYLKLSRNMLSGPITWEISKLSELEVLDLSMNSFSGHIPRSLMKLSSLRFLNLSRNTLSGSIPWKISKLSHLEVLDLSMNSFGGHIPRSLMKLSSLRFLSLLSNSLISNIPESVGQLRGLTHLDLGSNHLTSNIPVSLVNCSQLAFLNLACNNLTGGVPEELGKLPHLLILSAARNQLTTFSVQAGTYQKLEELYLQENMLHGPVPAGIGSMKMLKTLVLSFNNLTGKIPRELGNCSLLEAAWLDTNFLSGSIPDEMVSRLNNIVDFVLARNRLSGPIPPGVSNWTRLRKFDLKNNGLTGELPYFSDLQELLLISLKGNRLTGHIPSSYKNLKSLMAINLDDNLLTGEIPDFSYLLQLHHLFLAHNSFSGPVTDWIGKLPKLKIVDLSCNRFSGHLPSNFNGMQVLVTRGRYEGNEIFDLNASSFLVFQNDPERAYKTNSAPSLLNFSHNQLSGFIPGQLGALRNLQLLDLSYNKLTGNIPSQLGEAYYLYDLRLSSNQLIGSIPDSLTKLTLLAKFNVSYNHLSGQIPTSEQFSTFENSSYLGNDELCGGVLGTCPKASSAKGGSTQRQVSRRLSSGALAGIVCSVAVVLLASVVFAWLVRSGVQRRRTPRETTTEYIFGADVSLTAILSATANFSSEYVLGRGGFGTVYKASLPSGITVAIKRLKRLQDESWAHSRSFIRELKTAGQIRHRNIVKLHGFFKLPQEDLLVYDYMPSGSVGDLLYKSSEHVPWELRHKIAVGTAQALSYLHFDCCPRIIHRDIKTNNILLDQDMTPRIADFGLAKVVEKQPSSMFSALYVAGTCGYIAPEYYTTLLLNEKTDVYSYGVVLLELLLCSLPTDERFHEIDMVSWVRSKLRAQVPMEQVIDPLLWELASKKEKQEVCLVLKVALLCTSNKPVERPSMQHVVEMLRQVCKS